MIIKTYFYGKDDLSPVFSRPNLDDAEVERSVLAIIADVRARGDAALAEYTLKYDGYDLKDGLLVTEREFEEAYSRVSPQLLAALRRAGKNVLDYHERQRGRFKDEIYASGGSKLGWLYRPLSSAGIYVPGGKAAYPSSILMCVLPAKAAGVENIVVATPNPRNPLTLVAARECGVDKVYKLGGAQAVAALAYGTQSVKKVDAIAGPGNIYVACAKKAVYGAVAVDMVAGPSEILVIADKSADAVTLAADMLSQAEHDQLAASICVCDDAELAARLAGQLEIQAEKLERYDIIKRSLQDNGAIIVVPDTETALRISDAVAPEHLEIRTENAGALAAKVKNAGAVFVGHNSPEPLGDYFAGPSHCLPTGGTARFFSGLSVDTFMKRTSYIEYCKDDLRAAAGDIAAIADCEGLTAHAGTVRKRFPEENI